MNGCLIKYFNMNHSIHPLQSSIGQLNIKMACRPDRFVAFGHINIFMPRTYYKRTALLLVLLLKTALIFSQTPEDEGFSSKGLSEIFTYVKEKKANIHSLLIMRNKKVVLDAYFYPFRPG